MRFNNGIPSRLAMSISKRAHQAGDSSRSVSSTSPNPNVWSSFSRFTRPSMTNRIRTRVPQSQGPRLIPHRPLGSLSADPLPTAAICSSRRVIIRPSVASVGPQECRAESALPVRSAATMPATRKAPADEVILPRRRGNIFQILGTGFWGTDEKCGPCLEVIGSSGSRR